MPTYFYLDFLFYPYLETEVQFPNLCNLTSLIKKSYCLSQMRHALPCSRIHNTTSIDLEGKGHSCWPPWSLPQQNTNRSTSAEHIHLSGSIFLKVQKTNLPHLEEMLEQTCSSFWVCQGGKIDYRVVKALWKLNSISISKLFLTITRQH